MTNRQMSEAIKDLRADFEAGKEKKKPGFPWIMLLGLAALVAFGYRERTMDWELQVRQVAATERIANAIEARSPELAPLARPR